MNKILKLIKKLKTRYLTMKCSMLWRKRQRRWGGPVKLFVN
jgi:hypothetical protein